MVIYGIMKLKLGIIIKGIEIFILSTLSEWQKLI